MRGFEDALMAHRRHTFADANEPHAIVRYGALTDDSRLISANASEFLFRLLKMASSLYLCSAINSRRAY